MNHDEIICIIDKSGSMEPRRADAIGGFNRFLEDQKKIGTNARLTLVLFDDKRDVVYSGKEISHVKPLDAFSYAPGGSTALLDAVGYTIDRVGDRLSAMHENERPRKVIVAILTDGEENASREYTIGQVSRMIEHQRHKYNWEFFFLGANANVWTTAHQLNIPKSNAFMYDAKSSMGMARGFASYSNTVAASRMGNKQPDDAA